MIRLDHIRNILWDVDGTLFDTYPAISAAILAATAEQGVLITRDHATQMAQMSLGNTLPDLAKLYNLDIQRLNEQFEFYLAGTPLGSQRPFRGLRHFLRLVRHKGGINLIATHRRPDSLIPLLKYYRMRSLFADILTTSNGYPRKPDPAMFNELISRHHIKREQTLAIGDRDLDLIAGQAAGVMTCFFGNGLHQVNPDLSITDYFELIELLQ